MMGFQGTYLSDSDLIELTGRRIQSKWREWLINRGWKFVEDCNGKPKVLRAHHDLMMGMSASGSSSEPVIDYSRIRK